MKALLDTHAFLWFIEGARPLGKAAVDVLQDERNEVLLSQASVWEMAIKHSMGRLPLNLPFDVFATSQLEANAFALLGIRVEHLFVIAGLPFHHSDPFDRLLVAQSRVEGVPIAGSDRALDAYGVQRIW